MGGAIDPASSDLLARLYAGVASERPWQDFLESLARWMDASFATIIISAGGRSHPATFLTPGADAAFNASYASSLFAEDPFQGLPDGIVTSYAEFTADLPPDQAAPFRAIMHDTGFDQVLGIDLRFARRFEARFRISRHRSLPDFTAVERGRLQDLVAHLRIAVDLFERLQFAGAEHGVFHSAAQGLGLAMMVLDRERHIVSANPLADHILAQAEGLRRRGNQLVFARSEHQRTVVALLDHGNPAAAPARFRVERPHHGDVVITARPLELTAIHAGTGALALFFARPGPEQPTDPQILRDVFGLTSAEARLAAALTSGSTLVEAAQAIGIAHNTAKVQLRSVFAKTGVHRQAQLVALITSLGG
ncbi:helix-turn-helix transcriptional regulator [Novosphingobium sp.]|uniref:helix-turn-helix transcriptional regulator n=1 Tax=Novosphingobium sp. TaxID=1874826 RepID=UPI0033427162